MSVRPLRDKKGAIVPGTWVIDYYPLGRKGKRERRVYAGGKADAYELEAQLRRTHNLPSPINPKAIDVYPEYLHWLELHRSSSYKNDMKLAFKNLLPFFGNIRLSHITRSLMDKYKSGRPRNKGFEAICAINKELRYFGTFINWCVKYGYASPLPFRIEKLPYKRKPPKFIHPSNLDKILENLRGRHADRKRALILLMFECGLRWKEASHICWENIDWADKIIYLKETKGGAPAVCFLPDGIAALLNPFKREDGWVFENYKREKPWRSIKKALDTAADRAGIPHIRPHMLRRTGADMMRRATKDLEVVKNFLRHKDIATTQLYLGVSRDEIIEGMKKTADYIRQIKDAKLHGNKN